MQQVTIEKQLLQKCRNGTTTILLNYGTGWVIGRALLLARAGAAIRKEVKLRWWDAKGAKQIVKNGPRSVWPPILRGWRRTT